jgi:membrane protein implicated in regulation of membrane protease activity
MTWQSFYLTCFLFGLLMTLGSFLLGAHLHVHFHPPHGFDFFDVHVGSHGSGGKSVFNLSTILVFLTWFGGTGYVLTRYRSAGAAIALSGAIVVGFVGGALMYLFMARVFIANEKPLRDEDFEMVGILGRVSSSIREAGTGELIYTQQGTRRSCGARSEDGRAVERGTEVVVMRYEKGIAYVRRFEELHPQA